MRSKLVTTRLTLFVFLSLWACFLACDIFLASKCPSPPTYQAETFNYTAFCKESTEFVDCINKKLKNCKRVQEYGPALETIKWTFKLTIKNVNILRPGIKNLQIGFDSLYKILH